MEFLLINHPLDCPVCDKGGECPLQNQAMSNGRGETRFSEGVKRTFPKPINISPQVLLDRERCVVCQRCTRFSEQIAGDPFIALIERGAQQQVGIAENEPFLLLLLRQHHPDLPGRRADQRRRTGSGRGRSTWSRRRAVAEHDSCGSAIRVDHRRGKVMRRLAGNDPEVNEEWITDKDRFAFHYATQADRLAYPQVRDEDGELRPASWPEAFAVAARGLAGGRQRRRTDRRSHDRRGRLRLQQVRPGRARHQRHRLPGPPALRRGGVVPRRRGRAPPAATGRDVRRPRVRRAPSCSSGSSPRTRPARSSCGCARPRCTARTRVLAIAPYATRGLAKMRGHLVPTAPGDEAAAIDGLLGHADHGIDSTAVILVGERLATVPGALSAAAALAAKTGARLAWVPAPRR